MARCRRCGKSGLFFHVNQEGYCELCAMQLRDEAIEQHRKEYKRKMAMEAAAKGIKPEELEKPTDEVLYTLAIVSGLIQLHANYLDIKWDKMHESIPLQNVLSFTIEEHSIGPNRIRIATAQAATANINLGYGVSSAVGGGNHVYGCSATELPTAYKIRDYISNWTAKHPRRQLHRSLRHRLLNKSRLQLMKSASTRACLTMESFRRKNLRQRRSSCLACKTERSVTA